MKKYLLKLNEQDEIILTEYLQILTVKLIVLSEILAGIFSNGVILCTSMTVLILTVQYSFYPYHGHVLQHMNLKIDFYGFFILKFSRKSFTTAKYYTYGYKQYLQGNYE